MSHQLSIINYFFPQVLFYFLKLVEGSHEAANHARLWTAVRSQGEGACICYGHHGKWPSMAASMLGIGIHIRASPVPSSASRVLRIVSW